MSALDRIAADLREHERQQDKAEIIDASAESIARDLAVDLMADADQLSVLVIDNELGIWCELSRALMHIDHACDGNPISRDACLSALSRIKEVVNRAAVEEVAYKAHAIASQESES